MTAARPRIAVFAGPTATILNAPPLRDGYLRPQRLGVDAEVYVVARSAHPMEHDTLSRLQPDAYVDDDGNVTRNAAPAGGTALYRVTLPRGLLIPLPYTIRDDAAPQTFYPDASRVYEEVDRLAIDDDGRAGVLTEIADFVFFRPAPPAGYVHTGPRIERRGEDFFPYGDDDVRAEPTSDTLAKLTNEVQAALAHGAFDGAQWLEGSPVVEETLYWLSLLIDTTVPIVGHVSQYMHQTLASDGARNLVDGVRYIASRAWAADDGRDRVGPVLVADGVVLAARDFIKTASRPGGYEATGAGWGAVGSLENGRPISIEYVPTRRHTHSSELNVHRLPRAVDGTTFEAGKVQTVRVDVIERSQSLAAEAIPHVVFVKYGRYGGCRGGSDDPAYEVHASIEHALRHHRLAGFVAEGIVPNGRLTRELESALRRAAYSGMPVVRCGRGTPRAFTASTPMPFVGANNLSSNKARILLMAAMLKLGALPPATDPAAPTSEESDAVGTKVIQYQEIFDTH
jgi:L-asparaginase